MGKLGGKNPYRLQVLTYKGNAALHYMKKMVPHLYGVEKTAFVTSTVVDTVADTCLILFFFWN